jgi:hypothetical protein
MVMRRMRRQTRSQFGDMEFHREISMRFPVADNAALVGSVVSNRQVIKVISLGGQYGSLCSCDTCRSYQSWEKEAKVSA